MIVGVPREIKPDERRVGLTTAGVRELLSAGHEVLIERSAGEGARISDGDFTAAGGRLVERGEVWRASDLVVKVKEPVEDEPDLLGPEQLLFTYLHLSAAPELAARLCRSGCTAIAYETVQTPDGRLPLLAPMSEVAGRLAAQAAADSLLAPNRGRGVLMGGVIGVEAARVVVVGAGVVGTNAASVAAGMGAQVILFDRDLARLRSLEGVLDSRIQLRHASSEAVLEAALGADAFIGAVLLPGARAPRVLTRDAVGEMRAGAAVVDVAIDQGGCIETARPTSHSDPTYLVDEVIHYCVTNMPGAVPVTATSALCNATVPYVLTLANDGVPAALERRPELRAALNIAEGEIVHPAVRASLAETGAALDPLAT